MDADNSWHPLNIVISMKTKHTYYLHGLDGEGTSVSEDIYDFVKTNMIKSNLKIKENISTHVILDFDSSKTKDGSPTLLEVDIDHKLIVDTIDY